MWSPSCCQNVRTSGAHGSVRGNGKFRMYAWPFDVGPKRLHPAPIAIEALPPIDAVLITHDHYDHLDMRSVQRLAQRGAAFYVPLGIGAHLQAWGVAAGLYLGGATPLVLIQCTGLFESGDALRNALHDWKLPLFAIIGYRSYLNQETLPGDTCLVFTEPILDAWRVGYRFITAPSQLDEMRAHLTKCRTAGEPGVVLIAEGKA